MDDVYVNPRQVAYVNLYWNTQQNRLLNYISYAMWMKLLYNICPRWLPVYTFLY